MSKCDNNKGMDCEGRFYYGEGLFGCGNYDSVKEECKINKKKGFPKEVRSK